jgi:hypothetical protein
MKAMCRVSVALLLLTSAGYFVVGRARGQSAPLPPLARTVAMRAAIRSRGQLPTGAVGPFNSEVINCSPAPCVLPPTQASEGGALVNTSPIVANPLNPKQLLLGSNDWNCLGPPTLGFFLSSDGGSNWSRVCMTGITTLHYVFWPTDEPLVGYDRRGTAYIAGDYFDNEGVGIGFVGLEKSSDGIHWSAPVVALGVGNTFTDDPWLVVDTNAGSPYLNSLYVSAVVIGPAGVQSKNRVVVSHSSDGGARWSDAALDPVQTFPAIDRYTNLAVSNDGTVYAAWMRCPGTGPNAKCAHSTEYMLFARSIDGGTTWSKPSLMTTTVDVPNSCLCWPFGPIPNTDVYSSNIPVIGVDNSSGPYAGNLYVVMYTWTGTYMRVQVIRSTDGGNTWSKPVPVAPASVTHDQFFPWLSVSSTGLVGVSWLDRRNDPANIDYQAFAAISKDGGQSFQPNVQLTTAFSNPNVNGYPNNEWMGDYTGNTWVGPDFIAAWMDSSNGVDMQDVVGGIRLH